jgi:hypothetical protein
MASDAPALEPSKQDRAAIDPGARHPTALPFHRGETATSAPKAYDRTFFLRVAHANAVQADLMKSSTIKLAESLKLLAKVGDLLRR